MRSPLLKMSASSLAKKIAEGEVTSHLVVSTFIQRIKEVNPIINAMVDARLFRPPLRYLHELPGLYVCVCQEMGLQV